MKLLVAPTALLLLVPAVAAAEDQSLLEPQLAPWIKQKDWFQLSLLVLAGAVGAAGVALATLRGQTPITGGTAKLRKRELVLQEEEAMFRRMWTDGKADPDAVGLPNYLTQKRTALESDRRRLSRNTGILHAFIGIGLALLFAQDIYQALVFGAGGPSILAAILARQQEKYKLKVKDDAIAAVRNQRKAVTEAVEKAGKSVKAIVVDPLDQQLRIAEDM